MNAFTRRLPTPLFSVWAGVAIVLVAFSAAPLAWMVADAARVASIRAVLADSSLLTMLGRTVALSLSVAALATVFGAITGYLLGATAWRGKTVARAVLVLPLAIPPYFHAVGWTTVLQPRGVAASFLALVFGTSPASISEILYSFNGAAIILALAYFPIAMLFCEKSLALSSPSLSEAARVFGANSMQTFFVARWPFIRPALGSSAMIIFLLATAELGVPTILKVPVFNFEVFTRLGAVNDITAATLLTLPVLAVGLLALVAERRITVKSIFQTNLDDLGPPARATAAQAGFNRVLFIAVAILVLVVPFGFVFADGANTEAMSKMVKLARRPVFNTLRYSVPASMIITLVAFVLSWTLRRATSRLASLTDWILIVGFAVPGTILALALLAVYDQPGVSRWVTPAALVIAALVVRYIIVGYRIVAGSVAQIPDEVLEASALDGAGPILTTWHVLMPLTRVALLATLAITFVLTTGEIGATILLYPPGGETLPIALYSIEANSPHAYVSALTILQLLVLLGPLAAIAAVIKFIPK